MSDSIISISGRISSFEAEYFQKSGQTGKLGNKNLTFYDAVL